jgi:hypothetical protein
MESKMADYDYKYGRMFGVIERFTKNKTIVEPEIIEKPSSFIDDLIRGKGFEHLSIVFPTQAISFFPTRKLAEEFHDVRTRENDVRNSLAVH